MSAAAKFALQMTEQGLIPDKVIRASIRRLLKSRLNEIGADATIAQASSDDTSRIDAFVDMMDASPIALLPGKANEQHYEVPAEFFQQVLGEHMKYSCAYWRQGVDSLEEAESAALDITMRRAEIEDGQRILELGCGWGSLTLAMAQACPNSQIVAVSNSASQKQFIDKRAAARGLSNIEVQTADMNDFDSRGGFDHVVSVEMFEHMRNYRMLFARIHRWLEPHGLFFMHIFCHRKIPYLFLDNGPADWMSRHFFSGGMMPSEALPLYFQDGLKLRAQWRWNGNHYANTSNAWLANMDRKQAALMPLMRQTYGTGQAMRWWIRWRIFFMACAELFAYRDGNEWWVSHYLFAKQDG